MVVMDLIKVLDDMDVVCIRRVFVNEQYKYSNEKTELFKGFSLNIPWSLIDSSVLKINYDTDVLFIDVDD